MPSAEKLPFRPGRLTIEGQRLLRATVVPQRKLEADHFGWHLDVETPPERAPGPLAVFADLHVLHQPYLVGVTFMSTVVLPPNVKQDEVPLSPLRDAIAKLFGESLWDSCTLVARQLAAMAALEGFDVPSKPPHSGSNDEDEVMRDEAKQVAADAASSSQCGADS